jgi:hypothetical protein
LKRAIVLVTLLGCARGDAVPPVANAAKPTDAAALTRRADAAFAASLASDLGQPFAAAARDREPVRALYLDACRAGDRRSCWLASAIHPHEADDDPVAETAVRDNCRAGDIMSCRAIRRPFEHDDLPGHAGRSCWGTVIAKRFGQHDCELCSGACNADVTQLHHECAAGFPLSCELASEVDSKHDSPGDVDRRVQLAREGCEHGLVRECGVWSIGAATIPALRRQCDLVIDRCRDLGERAVIYDQPIIARDAYERLCQYSRIDERTASCAPLIELYESGDAPEAAAGRRDALVRWRAASMTR